MSLLHDHVNSRNLRAFQLALDGSIGTPPTGPSYTSGTGKSLNRGVTLPQNSPLFDINARDWLGRTALHLACTSVEYIDYVRALLRHPNIDVNLPDVESLWTPLHRALYSANLSAACVHILFPRPCDPTSLFQSALAAMPRYRYFFKRSRGLYSIRFVQLDSQWNKARYRRCRAIYVGSQPVTATSSTYSLAYLSSEMLLLD